MEPRVFIRGTDTYSTLENPVPAPILRKSFDLSFLPDTANLSICVSGLYELYINEKNITRGFLCPYFSNPTQRLYYDVYDIAPYLTTGKNAIAVILGNGFANQDTTNWNFNAFPHRAPLAMALTMDAEGQGKHFTLESDNSFKVHSSPIVYDMYRFGTIYDARMEISGFSSPEFDDSRWENARLAEKPLGRITPSTAAPILTRQELTPVSIEKQEDFYYFHNNEGQPFPFTYVQSGWVYDFGCSRAGACRLKIKGRAGQQITLRHGEALRDGKFNMNSIYTIKPDHEAFLPLFQADTYILKGGEEEIFVPSFTYHGFRYVLVEGINDDQATEDLLTFLVFNSRFEQRSNFLCSDPVVNQLYNMAIEADLSNFHHFPTDCPQREKNGWTGDISVSACQMLMSFACSENFRIWLENVQSSQLESGQIPAIVPTCGWGYAWGSGPVWDSAIVNLPYYCYRFDGRTDIIQENAPMILRYLHYIAGKRDSRGLIACGLGDWCQPGSGNVNISSPLEFTDSTQIYQTAIRSAFLFDVIGMTEAREYALQLASELRSAIRTHLIDSATATAAGSCQTSQAVALEMGLFDSGEKDAAYARLLEFVQKKGDHIDCGMVGLRHIFHALFLGGDGDLALKMITREDAPSYGNMIRLGGTALFESLIPNGIQESQNHHFYGDIIHLFIEKLAGLQINPHMKDIHHVRISPLIPESISFAQASYSFGEESVFVRWEKKDDQIIIAIDLPPVAHGELSFAGKTIPLKTGSQQFIFPY